MTITTLISSVLYDGNASTLSFPYDFNVLEEEHLYVTINGTDIPQAHVIYPWAPTGIGVAGGGDVVFSLNPPPVGSDNVLIYRDVPSTQEIDYTLYDDFPSETHESALDKLTMLIQEAEGVFARSLQYPIGDTGLSVLPSRGTRALMFMRFDADGDVEVVSGLGVWGTISGTLSDQTDLQAALDAIQADADANAAAILLKADTSALALKEDDLGLPSVAGYILASDLAGVRTWASPTIGSGGNAVDVLLADAGGYYAGVDVEAALAELAPDSGVFTPTFEGGTIAGTGWTYFVQSGSWARVGKSITIQASVGITAGGLSGTATGDLEIHGFPAIAGIGIISASAIGTARVSKGVLTSGYTATVSLMNAALDGIVINEYGSSATASRDLQVSDLPNISGDVINVSITVLLT